MRSLAIDPAPFPGVAIRESNGSLASGELPLKHSHDEPFEQRFVRLRDTLNALHAGHPFGRVVVVDAKPQPGLYGGTIHRRMIETITTFCREQGIPLVSVPLADVKRAATGRGNGAMNAVVDAARRQWPRESRITASTARALWACSLDPSPAGSPALSEAA